MLYILFLLLTNPITCFNLLREYQIRKVLSNDIDVANFLIYDQDGETLLYHSESTINDSNSVEIEIRPSKQVIARLRNQATHLLYEGVFELWNNQSQQWIEGTIYQHVRPFGRMSLIEWHGTKLWMEHHHGSSTIEFMDEQHRNHYMAQYEIPASSFLWWKECTLKIFSNDLPDAIYMIGLIARDYVINILYQRPTN